MAIDIKVETLIGMGQGSALLPDRPSMCTMWRWATRGARGRVLDTVVIGGRRYTSIEAIQRFARQDGATEAPAIRTPAARERAIRKAEKELADAGI
jgi:hypothetical protein